MKVLTAELGFEQTKSVCVLLVRDSRWFEVTPMPDATYAITVKDEPGVRALFPEGTKFFPYNQGEGL